MAGHPEARFTSSRGERGADPAISRSTTRGGETVLQKTKIYFQRTHTTVPGALRALPVSPMKQDKGRRMKIRVTVRIDRVVLYILIFLSLILGH